jgi:integrase
MRQGELLALRWQDVDLENATTSVRRTLARDGGRVFIGEQKTRKSRVRERTLLRALPLHCVEHFLGFGHKLIEVFFGSANVNDYRRTLNLQDDEPVFPSININYSPRVLVL